MWTSRLSVSLLLLALIFQFNVAGVSAKESDKKTLVPADEAISHLCQTSSVIAYLADPKLLVPLKAEVGLEAALSWIGTVTPVEWEQRNGVYVVSVSRPTAKSGKAANVPRTLSNVRQLLAGLRQDESARIVRGESLKNDTITQTTRMSALAIVREFVSPSSPDWATACENALKDGSLRLQFSPYAVVYKPDGNARPRETVVYLSTEGNSQYISPDWVQATEQATYYSLSSATFMGVSRNIVELKTGLYDLNDVAKCISDAIGSKVEVSADSRDCRVYLRVAPMPADDLLQLLAQACCISLQFQEGRIILGASEDYQALIRQHKTNLK